MAFLIQLVFEYSMSLDSEVSNLGVEEERIGALFQKRDERTRAGRFFLGDLVLQNFKRARRVEHTQFFARFFDRPRPRLVAMGLLSSLPSVAVIPSDKSSEGPHFMPHGVPGQVRIKCREPSELCASVLDPRCQTLGGIPSMGERDMCSWGTRPDAEPPDGEKAFRLIVMRRPQEQDLFEDKAPYRYHAIASNRGNEDALATMEWYARRGDASENRIKDLKIGSGMEYMPCGSFQANAVFFAIGGLTYNLYLGFRGVALGKEWERSQGQTVRWRLFQTAGKIVRHGRQLFLKNSAAMLDVFAAIRERCARFIQEGGAVPETS
jgi:hypothetical protein